MDKHIKFVICFALCCGIFRLIIGTQITIVHQTKTIEIDLNHKTSAYGVAIRHNHDSGPAGISINHRGGY